jgi:hypothetical protein
MHKQFLASVAFAAVVASMPVFAGTLTDNVTPPRADTSDVTFYVSDSIAAKVFGFEKDKTAPTLKLTADAFDPRLIKNADIAYLLVSKNDAIETIKDMRGAAGRADETTRLLGGYALIMLDSIDLKAENQYAELIDDEIGEDSVLIVMVGKQASTVLTAVGFGEDTILTESGADILRTVAEQTLSLGGTSDSGDQQTKVLEEA